MSQPKIETYQAIARAYDFLSASETKEDEIKGCRDLRIALNNHIENLGGDTPKAEKEAYIELPQEACTIDIHIVTKDLVIRIEDSKEYR